MLRHHFGSCLLALSLVGLIPSASAGPWPKVAVADPTRTEQSFVAEAPKAMVVSAHPEATRAGLEMLKAGGNAFDAFVAVSFAVSVVKPQSTGIGGGGFMLGYQAGKKSVKVYDFRERAPNAATETMFLDEKGEPKPYRHGTLNIPEASVNGHLAAGVPGLVAGLVKVQKELGTLPLSKVMAPAIALAEKGFPIYKDLGNAIEERKDILAAFPGSKAIYFKNNVPLEVGDTLVQSDLAKTLQRIAATAGKDFYEGETAKKMVAEMEKGGGIMTAADLRGYRVHERPAVEGHYRGYRVVSMPPPSSGGVHIVEMLNILNTRTFDPAHFHNADSVHFLTETMRRAYVDRAEYLGDPDFVKVPVAGLLAKSYASKLARSIDSTKATPSKDLKPGQPAPGESPSTTHFSIVDGEGNAVSSTQTVNYTFGSCVVAEGTGVMLNDEMDDFSMKPGVPNAYGLVGSAANAVKARKTMLSSMSPTLLFDKSGQLDMVVGSPGGSRIITAVLQTILNRIDYGMDLASAVQAPRLHHQWLPDKLYYESGALSPEVLTQLQKMGHTVELRESHGDIQAIARTSPKSGWIGVSDQRHFGMPMGF